MWYLALGLVLSVPLLAQDPEIRLVSIASGIVAPTDIQSARDGSGRLFIAQQDGTVRILKAGALLAQPFLDIRSRTRAEGERGLLGLAFPPDYAGKQRFYVNYTDLNGNTVIAMYRAGANPDVADSSSETVLLNIAQPFPNHNGGQLRFGPDGYLYIGMGDGGSAGDPMNNAQNRNSLLGKLLRIDVESDPGRVRIPPDNPFVNVSGARPEIWAYGLRNPWRFSFDRATGDLFIGDVGQDRWEEIDFTPAASRGGENYGWPAAEGQACFRTNCSMQGTALPAAVYGHQSGDCSVTGGFMYRGPGSPGLRGTYLFADYCTGRMRAMRREGDRWVSSVVLTPGGQITTFGEDEAGEIYVGDAGRRTLYRIEGSAAPRITSALVNPATNAPGVVAGSIARAYGLGLFDTPGEVTAPGPGLPITLEGVSVKVDDIAAPVSRVSSRNGVEQVEFQLPFEAAGRSSVTVVVSRNGAAGAPVNVPLAPVQPGLYEGVGRSEDYTVVTVARPLEPGESAYVRATGLGPVSNPPATGAPATFDPLPVVTGKVELTLAGMPCEVEFAVLAPDLVGIYQINFRAPAGAPSGMQDLVASIGGVSSPPIKVAVR